MNALLSTPQAMTVIVVDEGRGATMSEVSRVSGLGLSTVQRALERLVGAGILRRTTPRGPFMFRPDAPRESLRELADWSLGVQRAAEVARAAQAIASGRKKRVPPTVKDSAVRDYLPKAIDRIVEAYHPARVILFGSQAQGLAGAESDVDLLVLFDSVSNRAEREVEIRRLLRDAPFPKDVVVAATADAPRAAAGTAVADAMHDGLVIYER